MWIFMKPLFGVVILLEFLTWDYHVAADQIECDHERQEDSGRRCFRSCENDYDCLSSKKKCMCDGKCGKSCINPNLRCLPEPSNIAHGRVTVSPFNRFGSIAVYICDEGYVLQGLHARVCQGDETWMGEPPRCEPNHGFNVHNQECGPSPVIANGVHNGKMYQIRFGLGTSLRYTCLPGFIQHKDSVGNAWCVSGGVWVGPNMTCSSSGCSTPPKITNGHLELPPQNIVGSRARYYCDPTFFLVGSSERTCLKDGSWDGREPSCQQARDCGAPGEINNGWRDPGYRFTYPTRVTYHCNEGFELQGLSPYRECQADGDWSGSLPECDPVHCGELGPPVHGTMIGSGTDYGAVVRFVCNSGYRVVGSLERTCQAEGTWSGHETFCEEINCGFPGPLWNGYLDGHSTGVGSVIFFRCNIRTKFYGTYFSTQCHENGQWSHGLPQCLGQCQIPSVMNATIDNGREGVWIDHSFVVELACLHGLVLNDSRPVVCNNGTWSIIPRCVPAPCNQPPPQIADGHRVFFNLAHGCRARYFCIAGYKLVDYQQYMTCEFGDWVGVQPRCEENFCPNPGSLDNGAVLKLGTHGKFHFSDYIITIKHGDRLEYRCNKDHKLVGPKGAACVNGKWSPSDKPKCVRSQHPIFNKLWHPFEEKGRGPMYYK